MSSFDETYWTRLLDGAGLIKNRFRENAVVENIYCLNSISAISRVP
jgi:3-methyladenine DNA glycosylase Tag